MTVFYDAIECIFTSWHALEHALSQKTGGAESLAISRWMIDVTEQYFYVNADLEPEEVGSYLNVIMDHELNVLVDDNSDLEIGSLLCKVYSFYKSGDIPAIQSIISSLPILGPSTTLQSSQIQSESDDETMECEALSSSNADAPLAQQVSSVDGMNIGQPKESTLNEIDGWTVVHKGHRKIK